MNNRDERNAHERRFITAFAISVSLHALLVAGSFYLQYLEGLKRPQLKTIEVSLVMLPGTGSPEAVDMSAEQPFEPEAEPLQEPPVEPPPVQSEPEKPEPVKKVPKKIPDQQKKAEKKTVKDKPKKPEKKVQQKPPSDFEQTLARLRQKVQEGPPSDLYKRSGPGRFGPGDGDYGAPMGPYERYLLEVVTIIRQNWSFTPQLIRGKGDIKAYVALTIEHGGRVSGITLDKESLSNYFNDTVIKAIEKSSPLPPVPEDVGSGAMRIGLVFTPRGIE